MYLHILLLYLNLNYILPILAVSLLIYVILKNIIINKIKEESPVRVIGYSYMPGYMYVDIREEKDYSREHLAKSINVPFSSLKNLFRSVPNDKTLIIISKDGSMSKKAISFLKDNGYDKLIGLKGGLDAWKKAGYPLQYGV